MLDLADVVRIGPEFSPAEQDRARAAAARDPRLRVALESAGYGLTQTLAAAPQLVARWEDAQTASPYAWAVLTAALDAARLGARAPLSADFLRAAAPGYCTSQQQAEAPGNWFEQALAYATGKLHGAAAALSPAGAGMGQIAGYTVADYLIQHASRERRSARVPASTWDAILSHIRDPADAARLADSARGPAAVPLRHPAVPSRRRRRRRARRLGAGRAAGRARGPGRSCAPGPTPATGTPPSGWPSCWPSAGDLDGLRARADAGDGHAAGRLAELLAERGDLDGLRARADAGDGHAAGRLAGCWPSAATWTGPRRSCGPTPATRDAARLLADLLAERGRPGRGRLLRARADAGDGHAAARAGRPAGRTRGPGRAARPGRRRRRVAAAELAELLAERGDLDELRARPTPATGTPPAAGRAAGRARGPGRAARPGRRRRRGRRPELAELLAC